MNRRQRNRARTTTKRNEERYYKNLYIYILHVGIDRIVDLIELNYVKFGKIFDKSTEIQPNILLNFTKKY
jgi:hypothetical protein